MRNPFGTSTWMTVYGRRRHVQLAAALHDLAAEWARRAIEEPGAGASALDRTVRLAAIGQAGELLIKSTLAGINAALIAGKTNMATLLRLTDNEIGVAPGKLVTAGAGDALARLNESRPSSSPKITEPKLLFDVRNDALHMGLAPSEANLQTALTELVTLVDEVFTMRNALGQSDDRTKFWSEKHLKIVEARQRDRHQQLVARYNELLADARVAYSRLTAGLDQDEQNRLVAELAARIPAVDVTQTVRPGSCPACHNTMWITYDVEREVYLDDSEMPSGGSSIPHGYSFFARVHARVESARCPVCGLSLEQSELILTNVPFTLELADEEATEEEEQGWRDAKDAEFEADLADYDRWDDDEPTDE